MKTWVRKTLSVGVLAAGALLFAPGGAAHADAWQSNGDNNGFLNGTQVYAPISVPINACGNSLALLGGAYSQAICGNDVFGGSNGHRRHGHIESTHVAESGWQSNGDNNGIANGSQLYAPINLPINLAGNSLGLLGEANSQALAGNRIESAQGGPRQINGDNNGFLNGTQFAAPISIPINVCGNSLGLLGQASSLAGCANDVFGRNDFQSDRGHAHWNGHGPHGNLGDHGHKAHHGHQGGHAGHQDPGYLGDHGSKPATNDPGYGNGTEPAGNDGYGATKPATNDPGYGGTKPATNDTGSASSSKGGRGAKSDTESTPVSSVTDTVGGMGNTSGLGSLGLLNALR